MKGVSYWVPLTYENLPRLYFKCEKITHGLQFYEKRGSKFNDGSDQFGAWLRVEKGMKSAQGRPGSADNDPPSPTYPGNHVEKQPSTAEQEIARVEDGTRAASSINKKIPKN